MMGAGSGLTFPGEYAAGQDRQGDRYLNWQNQYKGLIALQENAVHEACR